MNKKVGSFFVLIVSVFGFATSVLASSDHVLINEVQISGAAGAGDEFIELYNPTSQAVDMEGWRLVRGSSTSGAEVNLVSSISGVIAPHAYFLIAHPDYTGLSAPDLAYSASSNNVPSGGSVTLYSDAGITLVDRVGFGTSPVFEAAAIGNPVSGGSASRTSDDDTNNNFVDFSLNDVSDPQNASTDVPTPTPIPTETPEPTATPTATPTISPSQTPSPTPEPTATPAPSDPPVHVSTVANWTFPFFGRSCSLVRKTVRFGFFKISTFKLVCE
ncbi:lamin tail domain-containing protein [Candidatus Microgenomates bacterium]|nr:MAG: lamin tail domain-containing protein [Candidatus Microgenomates bacterium]